MTEKELMKIKRGLKARAKKLHLGKKRSGAYVFGTLRKIQGNPTGIPPRIQETFEEYGITSPKTQKGMMSIILRSLPASERTLDRMESAVEKYFKKMGQKAYDETMKSMGYVRANPAPYPDVAMANELYLFFQNDENLINRRYPEFVKNLERKVKRGIYDREKAVKLFMYLADEISKRYSKDFGDGKTHWASVPTRMELAKMLLRYYEITRDPSHRVMMNPSPSANPEGVRPIEGGGTMYTREGGGVERFRVMMIRQGLKARKIGMMVTRGATTKNLLSMLSQYTGEKYGSRDLDRGIADADKLLASDVNMTTQRQIARGLTENPFRVGGYLRETPEEAGYRVVTRRGNELILQDKSNGQYEIWGKSPNFAGAGIQYKGTTYEFMSSQVKAPWSFDREYVFPKM